MAHHALVRGLWVKIEPRPALIQAGACVEIAVSAAEPDLLERGLSPPQGELFELPGTEGDVWARLRADSAFSVGELLTLEPAAPPPD
jgi:hypothetical protein